MVWVSHKSLFSNTNDSVAKFYDFFYKWRFFVNQTLLLKYVNLWQRRQLPKTYNNMKLDFFFIAEQILAFASNPNMIREVNNLSPNFKEIVWKCFTLKTILIWIVRSYLSINSKHFHQKLYSNNLYVFDIICLFL